LLELYIVRNAIFKVSRSTFIVKSIYYWLKMVSMKGISNLLCCSWPFM